MDQIDPKSWLCPKGHHTNNPQQRSVGPFWHKQGWLRQEDLSLMGHHTINAQQQNHGAIWTKKLSVPHHRNSPQQRSDGLFLQNQGWLCQKDLSPMGHHTNSPQQRSDGPFWQKQGWLWQEDLSPMRHHTNTPQQQCYGPIWTQKLTVPYGSS